MRVVCSEISRDKKDKEYGQGNTNAHKSRSLIAALALIVVFIKDDESES